MSVKGRILVVDDDESVRESLKKVLEGSGYEVVLASDGAEAAMHFEAVRIDLLLLDLILPNQGGWDVFEQLTTRRPIVPVIIVTGLPGQEGTALMAGAGALFEKPLDAAALLQRMEELLAEPPEPRLERLCGRLQDTTYVRAARGWAMVPREEEGFVAGNETMFAEAKPQHKGTVDDEKGVGGEQQYADP
jgi:DNA-binding response OmpR family regulator